MPQQGIEPQSLAIQANVISTRLPRTLITVTLMPLYITNECFEMYTKPRQTRITLLGKSVKKWIDSHQNLIQVLHGIL